MKRYLFLLSFLSAGLLLQGCGSSAELTPAPEANEVAGLEEAARDEVAGVRVVAQANEWPGDQEIEREVTPVRVVVENSSEEPVLLRYDAFSLVGPRGRLFAAIPPFSVGGTLEEPVLVDEYAPIAEPGFVYDDFTVAPLYGSVYTGLGAYSAYPYYTPYYDAYDTYWADLDVALPTDDMIARALPEGVVERGGRVEGYLYFEHVTGEQLPSNEVTFRMDLMNPETGQMIGEIRVPFVVEED